MAGGRGKADQDGDAVAPPARGPVIRIPKTAELVANEIRKLITAGVLGEGDTLQPEGRILQDFNVSRPTLREAFRILESEKLISVSRGSRGGAKVHAPQPEMVARYAGYVLQSRNVRYADVYRTRSIIEPPAARLLAERRSTEASTVLRNKIAEQRAARDSDQFAFLVADFHTSLIRLAGNETLILLSSVLEGIVARHQTYVAQVHEGTEATRRRNFNAGMRSQEKLVDLIETGDGVEAEAHWRRHMDNAARVWLGGGAGDLIVSWTG